MPTLRDLQSQTFTDKFGNVVTLEDTDIGTYMDNPELADIEQETTLARYGGKPIQADPESALYAGEERAEELTALGEGAPYQKPGEGTQPIVYNRDQFEQSVFKTIGGNPFGMDVIKEVNAASEKDLPDLFQQVFGRGVMWEDRDKLDAKEKTHWQNQIKQYRAYLKDTLESQKEAAIERYNMMMNRFDREQKENEAAMKKVEAKTEKFRTEATARRKEQKRDVKDLRKEKQDLLKRMTELALEGYGGGQETLEEMTEMTNIRTRIIEINSEMYAPGIKASEEHEEKKIEAKKKEATKVAAKKTKPKTGKKVVRTGVHKGRKVVQYEDGSIEYAD